jgi:hypothetical protein
MRVLAMAYAGRPLERLAVGRAKGVIYLSTANSTESFLSHGVGFPESYVFEFERELFESLQRAWSSNDAHLLESLWAKATPLREPDKIAA